MKVFHALNEVRPGPGGVCLAIGFFDGVHRGHQRIIAQAVQHARATGGLALVLTFDSHPNTIVAPHRVPSLIYTVPERLRRLAECGPGGVLLLGFDVPLSERSGEQFVRWLAHLLGPLRSISVGQNFVFGYRRSGDIHLLRQLGRELGFVADGVEYATYAGAIISSTRIREAVRGGDFRAAAEMLGRPYALCSRVIRGRGLGRQLGFPTANLETAGMALPPAGVYAARVQVNDQEYPAVLNIGRRPTLEAAAQTVHVETHLLDYTGDLYGTEICIRFERRLREERKFAHVDDLKAQIARDIEQAGRLL